MYTYLRPFVVILGQQSKIYLWVFSLLFRNETEIRNTIAESGMDTPKLQTKCQLWSLIGLDNGHSSCNKNGLFRLIPWIPTWRGRYEMCAVRASSHAWMRVRRSHGRQCRGGGRPTLLSHVALFPLFIAHHCCVSTRHICTASRVYIAFGFTPSNNVVRNLTYILMAVVPW